MRQKLMVLAMFLAGCVAAELPDAVHENVSSSDAQVVAIREEAAPFEHEHLVRHRTDSRFSLFGAI
jgi:hypothetical protein